MTSSAPSWVSYAALGVAGFAALVALASATISYLMYRAGGPRVRLQVEEAAASNDPTTGRVMLKFTVLNQGRGDVTIQSLQMTPVGMKEPVAEVDQIEGGSPLPHRMQSHSREVWFGNVLQPMRRWEARLRGVAFPPGTGIERVRFGVELGGGELVHDWRAEFDVREQIARAFPE